MAKVVGDIAVAVGADVSGLQAGMRRGTRSISTFEKRAVGLAKTMTKVAGAFAVFTTALAVSSGKAATEIENLSRLSGIGAEKFQRLAEAGRTVGFSQEKMADIFKDTNDKFGDFLATGAGPLADFFERIAPKVGVTADQFARLSGPDALQLYVTSLEEAGVSQQQMTFYMEALANDATALVPLLANNGKEMRRLGDEAQRAGRIMGGELVANGAEMDRKLADLAVTIKTKAQAAVLEFSDEIIAMAEWITDTAIPAIVSLAQSFSDFVEFIQPAIDKVAGFIGLLAKIPKSIGINLEKGGGVTFLDDDGNPMPDPYTEEGRFYEAGKDLIRSDSGRRTTLDQALFGTTTGTGLTPSSVLLPPVSTVTSTGGGTTDGTTGGGGGSGLDDFQAFREQLLGQAEQIDAWREDQLEKLREYREAKLATEEEFNTLEAEINKQHADALAEIELRAQQQKLQAFSGALSDLSGLMASENKKIFQVGKAAAIAQATLEGYKSASSAWAHGMSVGGPPLAAAFTAASVAKTAGIISSIASASASGGGGGGGGVSGGATPPPAAPLEVRASGFTADQLFTGDSVSNLFDQLQDEAGDRGIRVSFTS